MIPHNRPTLDSSDAISIAAVIDSGYLAQSTKVKLFEETVSSFCGLRYGVALSSGTSALYVALKVAGVGAGNKVILPTYVCSALLNAIFMTGATPVLVDVYGDDYNANWGEILSKIDQDTRAIIIPHIHGVPATIYLEQNPPQGVTLIEDCATAMNSYVITDNTKQHVGQMGHMAVFSFYATKYLTTGQGGMICTNDWILYNKILEYREFDCCREYQPRFNFQMTDIQAAMGINQMSNIHKFAKRRREIAYRYMEICRFKGIKWQSQYCTNVEYNNYRFIIELRDGKRNLLKDKMKHAGVCCIVPIESYELLHRYLRYPIDQFAEAENIANCTLSIPIYPSLNDNELETITNVLINF